ncbi:MAG: hypothetical protein LUF04_16190 [Bacteroides sp.]|nr:hypothetical protein [Bacteroides sp.]
MAKEKMIGQVTPEQIAEWKAKYTDIWAIKVPEDEYEENSPVHVCYVRKPDKKVLGAASEAMGARGNYIKFNEVVLRQCWLGGSDMIRNDSDMFLSAGGQLSEISKVAEAELEKL